MIILFDLDGTIIDSTEAILESFHNSFDIHNHTHPNDEDIKSLIGYPLDIMYARLGVADDKVWDFVATYKEHYRKISTQKTKLLPRAKEAVILASTFATLGIVTTKTQRYSKLLMEHFGMMEYFEVLIGREDVTEPKPSAEPIQKALKKLDKKDDNIWMIGDTQMDILSAKNANINSIAVLCGYSTKTTLQKYTANIQNTTLEAVQFLKPTPKD
jgi:phosphoglycolate phosphatase